MQKQLFETINGLRGLAAILVVTWHNEIFFRFLRPAQSYLVVDLFFILSGFVIAHSYENKFKLGMNPSYFFCIRLVRLYPLYFIGTIFFPLILNAGMFFLRGKSYQIDTHTSISFAMPFSLLLLPTPGLLTSNLYPLNVPAWSLFFELVINLIYSITWKKWTCKNILIFVSLTSLLMLTTERYFAVDNGWGAGGFRWAEAPFGLMRVCYSFPMGVLIYKIYKHTERHWKFRVNSLYIIMALPILVISKNYLISKIVMFVGMPALVAVAATSKPTGKLRAFCITLGAASYAIYVLHQPLLSLLQLFHSIVVPSVEPQLLGPFFLLGLTVVSLLFDRYFDQPTRTFLLTKLREYIYPSEGKY